MGIFVVLQTEAPHPNPLPREREPICKLFKIVFDWIFQVDV